MIADMPCCLLDTNTVLHYFHFLYIIGGGGREWSRRGMGDVEGSESKKVKQSVVFYTRCEQGTLYNTLIKNKIEFSSDIMKFRKDRLQSHTWLTASSWYGQKYLRISSCIRKPFLFIWLYNWSHLNFLIFEENFDFFFISAHCTAKASRPRKPIKFIFSWLCVVVSADA